MFPCELALVDCACRRGAQIAWGPLDWLAIEKASHCTLRNHGRKAPVCQSRYSIGGKVRGEKGQRVRKTYHQLSLATKKHSHAHSILFLFHIIRSRRQEQTRLNVIPYLTLPYLTFTPPAQPQPTSDFRWSRQSKMMSFDRSPPTWPLHHLQPLLFIHSLATIYSTFTGQHARI